MSVTNFPNGVTNNKAQNLLGELKLIDPTKYVMLGIRGSLYDPDDVKWAKDQGITIITIDEYYEMGLKKTMEIIQDILDVVEIAKRG